MRQSLLCHESVTSAFSSPQSWPSVPDMRNLVLRELRQMTYQAAHWEIYRSGEFSVKLDNLVCILD